MLVDRFGNLLGRLKHTLFRAVGAALLGFLAVLLIAPEVVSDFVNSVPIGARILVLGVIFAIIGMAIYRQRFTRPGKQIRGLIVKAPGGALAELGVESARDQILAAITKLPSIRSAEAAVSSRSGKAVVNLAVMMADDGVSLPEKQQEINRVLNDVVQKRLGVRMGERPVIRISLGGEMTTLVSSSQPDEHPHPGKAELLGVQFGARLLEKKSEEQIEKVDQKQENKTTTTADSDDADGESKEFWEFLKANTESPSADESPSEASSTIDVEDSDAKNSDTTSDIGHGELPLLDNDGSEIRSGL